MPTASGHTTAIRASKVKGTAIYDSAGERIGHVEDVILDKLSNRVLFAAVGLGGVLGVNQKYAPMPWSMLNYNPDKEGYVVPLSHDILKKAPSYDMKELVQGDGAAGIQKQSFDYFKVPQERH